MGKGKRLKNKRKVAGKGFFKEFSDRFAENFQREVRNSEIWDQMVAEFGEKKAKELLNEIKAEVRPGPALDGSRNRTKDIR